MQLVRYLISQSFKLIEKYKIKKSNVDQILVEEIFDKANIRIKSFIVENGLTYHIVDIYYKVS